MATLDGDLFCIFRKMEFRDSIAANKVNYSIKSMEFQKQRRIRGKTMILSSDIQEEASRIYVPFLLAHIVNLSLKSRHLGHHRRDNQESLTISSVQGVTLLQRKNRPKSMYMNTISTHVM